MKTFKYFFSITVCAFLFIVCGAGLASGRDDDGVVEYPDGRWGMDIGGGYQTMPDGNGGQTMVQPAAYRQEYKDTPYGPQTQQGFEIFPDFRFEDEKGPPPSKVKETYDKEMMFYAAQAGPNSSMSGVSRPRKSSD